jgi:folate-binding protein YgfZ
MTLVAQRERDTSGLSDSPQEMTALLAGCGVHKLDHALISLTGRDRVRWLNGMVSNNVRDLAVGHGVYAFVLNAQGQIQGDLYIFNRGESLLLEIARAQVETLLPLLRRYIIMDKVEVEDLSDKLAVIGIAGPKSVEVLGALGLSSGDTAALELTEGRWKEVGITLVRGDNPCVPNYELWVPTEHADSLCNAVLEPGAQEVTDDALETFRILCGIPKVSQDIRERTLPQETGQERALSFTKGCYIGQEIVERIRARGSVHRTFVGFEVEGPASSGTKIQYEGKDVGEITSVASAPLKQKRLALGYMRKDAMLPDRTFAAGDAVIRAVPLPFSGIFN